jgi:hypothetical protein
LIFRLFFEIIAKASMFNFAKHFLQLSWQVKHLLRTYGSKKDFILHWKHKGISYSSKQIVESINLYKYKISQQNIVCNNKTKNGLPGLGSSLLSGFPWPLPVHKEKNLLIFGEKVTTTKITKLKTKKNIKKFANHHYIESPFLVDHYYDITTASIHQKWLFSWSLHQKLSWRSVVYENELCFLHRLSDNGSSKTITSSVF